METRRNIRMRGRKVTAVDDEVLTGDGEDAGTGSHRWFLHGVFG